jgi:hypothetical protein
MEPLAAECINDATAQAFELRQSLHDLQGGSTNTDPSANPMNLSGDESNSSAIGRDMMRVERRPADDMDIDDEMPALIPQ